MNRLVRLVVLALSIITLSSSYCLAQAPTPSTPVASAPAPPAQPNTGITLTAGLSYTLLTNGPGNSVNVTKLDVALPITDKVSLIYNQYMIPSAQANVFIGGVRYSLLLSQIIKSAASANSSLKIDPTKFRIYADCGLGSRRDSISNARVGVAGACNGGLSYNPVSNVAISLEGGYIRTGAVAGATGTNATKSFLFGTSPMIAPGVKLTF
jgi:opacity protein-like surface antigen